MIHSYEVRGLEPLGRGGQRKFLNGLPIRNLATTILIGVPETLPLKALSSGAGGNSMSSAARSW
jgi:hypothetical protein